jgi:hypothetical protein
VTGDSAMHSFAGRPQPVEIHHAGIWYSGELLGWRNEDDGRIVARVRCRVDGLRHSFWKDFTELRLPDPAHPPRTEALAAALGRPAPTGPDEVDDQTRPHVLRAGPGVRPAKPVHAVTPPAPRAAPVSPSRIGAPRRRTETPLSVV